MNELLSDTRFWLVTLGAAIVGLVKYLFTQHKAETKERIDKIERESVRRSEFDQWRADSQQKHQENLAKLDDIATATTGTHKRIDDLYRDLIGRAGDR